jgi:hypothetical protein
MISHNDLLQIKERMLIAAEAARAMVDSSDPTAVRFDQTQYWQVHMAFAHLHEDVTAVMAELDTLRAMFVDRVHQFFGVEDFNSEVPVNAVPVAGVPDALAVGGGEEARDDQTVPSQPVPAGRTHRRRRAKSAKPRGDSAGVPPVSEAVDARAEGGSVGGEPQG